MARVHSHWQTIARGGMQIPRVRSRGGEAQSGEVGPLPRFRREPRRGAGSSGSHVPVENVIVPIERLDSLIGQQRAMDLKKMDVAVVVSLEDYGTCLGHDDVPSHIAQLGLSKSRLESR